MGPARRARAALLGWWALWWQCGVGGRTDGEVDVDVARIVRQAADTVYIAKFATLSTMAFDGSISSRVIYPKPPNASLGESPELHVVSFATNNRSRKFGEIMANSQATLVYYDDGGRGEVTLKGHVRVCSIDEARKGWYARWQSSYSDGPDTPFYSLLRMEATDLEFVSYSRFHVDEGGCRRDWRPLTLRREAGVPWAYRAPPLDVDFV